MMSRYVFQFCLGGLLALLGPGMAAISQTPSATPRLNITIQADQVRNYGLLIEQMVSAANNAIANAFATNPNADPTVPSCSLIFRHRVSP